MNALNRTVALLAVAGWPAVGLAAAEDVEEPYPIEVSATLRFPSDGAIGIPANTGLLLLDVVQVEVVAQDGTRIPCALGDPTVPDRPLPAGTVRVEAVPVSDATNWAGDGVMVDLGGFTVADGLDDQAPVVESAEAQWLQASDALRVQASVSGQPPAEPLALDIDVGDATQAPDGVPEMSGGYSSLAAYGRPLATLPEVFDMQTAFVRVRATDIAGNVGDWSVDQPVQVVASSEVDGSGCSVTRARASSPGPTVAALAVLLLAWVRPRAGR